MTLRGQPGRLRLARGPVAERIRFLRPELPPIEEIENYFARSREISWYSNGGPCHELLTARVCSYLGVAHCLPVANCTLGLVLALRSLTRERMEHRDRVILPSYTFPATVAAVEWCGLRPVFADVDAEGWHLDPASLEEALSRQAGTVGAILACSTFGTPPPPAVTRSWVEQAAAAGVPLLVDSAAGFGAGGEAGRLGRQGDAEAFSWHATKPFAIGEGGLVATASAPVADELGRLINFGFDDDHRISSGLGLNAKLDEWHAATALAALDRIDAVLEARRRRARSIVEALGALGYTPQAEHDRGSWQFVPLLAPTAGIRAAALEAAGAAGIEVRAYFDAPMHTVASLRSSERVGSLAVTDELAARCISLPMANDLSDREIDRIVTTMQQAALVRA